jgi:hypothetical protein
LIYLKEYQRFLDFTHYLRTKIKETIPTKTLIESLTREISKLALTPQERKIFEGEDAVANLLANPLLKIGLTASERDAIKKQ